MNSKIIKNGPPTDNQPSVQIPNLKTHILEADKQMIVANQNSFDPKMKTKSKNKNRNNRSKSRESHDHPKVNKSNESINEPKKSPRVAIMKPVGGSVALQKYKYASDPLELLSKITGGKETPSWHLLTQSIIPDMVVYQLSPTLYTKTNREPGNLKQFLRSSKIAKRNAKMSLMIREAESPGSKEKATLPKIRPSVSEIVRTETAIHLFRRPKVKKVSEIDPRKILDEMGPSRITAWNPWDILKNPSVISIDDAPVGILRKTTEASEIKPDTDRICSGDVLEERPGSKKQVKWKQDVDVIYYNSHPFFYGGGEILHRATERLREEWEQQERAVLFAARGMMLNHNFLDSLLLNIDI